MQGEIHQQGDQREADEDRDADVTTGEEAERHPRVARVDQLDPGEEPVFFAGDDRVANGLLAELVRHDHHDPDEQGTQPRGSTPIPDRSHRADQPWMSRPTTTLLMISSVTMARIGLRSNPPMFGRMRRKRRRNGSLTSRRNPITLSVVREYGGRKPAESSSWITMWAMMSRM